MTSIFSVIKTSLKLGPISILYLMIIINSMGDGPKAGDLTIIFFFGTMICWVIAFFVGLVFFGAIAVIHEIHPLGTGRVEIFEKLLPIFIFSFGLLVVAGFLVDDKDQIVISILLSAYLSAITGWYFFAFDYFKELTKKN